MYKCTSGDSPTFHAYGQTVDGDSFDQFRVVSGIRRRASRDDLRISAFRRPLAIAGGAVDQLTNSEE